MTGLVLRTRLENFEQVDEVFRRLATADTQPLMDEIGDYVLSETLLNFDNERTPDGERWTQSQRAREEGGKTLQDSGNLRSKYTYEATGDSVAIGTNMVYAAIHHFGGTVQAKSGGYLTFKVGDRWVKTKKVEIPARPALGLNAEMNEEIGEQVMDFYRRLIA